MPTKWAQMAQTEVSHAESRKETSFFWLVRECIVRYQAHQRWEWLHPGLGPLVRSLDAAQCS